MPQRLLSTRTKSTRTQRPAPVWIACAALAAAMLAGCATTKVDSQWADPAFSGKSLRGARVYLVCEAPDEVLARTCQDRLAAEVTANGATPVVAPSRLASPDGRMGTADAYLEGARQAGARAVLLTNVGPAARVVNSGSSVGLGLGGFGSGRIGGGLGISLPIGGGQVSTTYGANTLLTDVASGRLMWTANTSTPSGDSPPSQVDELVKAAIGGAQKAGFF